jgi:hypothetical protein
MYSRRSAQDGYAEVDLLERGSRFGMFCKDWGGVFTEVALLRSNH